MVINEAEAKTVRSIFRRYVELKSVRLLKAELDDHGIISKLRKASDGSDYGGIQLESEDDLATLTVPASFKRAGGEMKVIVADRSDPASPDSSLIRLLVRAHVIRDWLMHDKSLTLDEIAKSERIVPSYATRLFRLTLLAPDIVGAILDGKQPPELNARRLIDSARLPLDWREQRQVLGFA